MPKPVVAMVAGYAIGGGHVLHVVLRPHDRGRQRRVRPDRAEGRLVRRRLRHRPARAHRSARSARRRSGSCAASTTRRQALAMGTRERRRAARAARGRDRANGAARCCAMSPLALRAAEGGVQRRRRRARRRAAARRRRDAPLLHDRGGAGGPRRVRAEARPRLLAVPQAAVSRPPSDGGPRRVGAGRPPADARRGVTPVVVGTAAAGHVVWWRFACALARRRRAAGRRELRERLLRRRARRRHGRAARPAAADGLGRGLAARGARRGARVAVRRPRSPGSRSRSRPRRWLILFVGALAHARRAGCTRAGRGRTRGSASARSWCSASSG